VTIGLVVAFRANIYSLGLSLPELGWDLCWPNTLVRQDSGQEQDAEWLSTGQTRDRASAIASSRVSRH